MLKKKKKSKYALVLESENNKLKGLYKCKNVRI